MKQALETPTSTRRGMAIALQPASADIWDAKYRLKSKDGHPVDETIGATYERVARALADIELPEQREHWYEQFLWALHRDHHLHRLRYHWRLHG